MGRRSQRSKDASAKMAAQVAAGLAPWTRSAGFIANRLKPLCVPCLCMREQQMQAQIEELQQQNARHQLTASGAVYAAEQRAALAACTAHALTLQLGLLQHANVVMAGEAMALQQRAAEGDQAAAAAADLEARCQDLEAQCQDLVMECHEQQAECLRLSAAAPPSSPTAPTPYQSSLPASQDKRVARYSTARYCVEYSLAALRLLVDCNLSFEKVQETIVRTLGLHILPGQQLEDMQSVYAACLCSLSMQSASPGGTAASPGGTAASPGGGTQALATNKARLGKRQQQAQSKAERVMKRIRCLGMTVEELKHLSQKLGVGSVGKNRRQLLERIAEYCKQ
ncbi:hypothetical protein QJQ45_004159 [Haematococcus lacustris]|nr:hypothetical protein QJQ45_004159 [Haematococcus lacustris]